MACANDFLETLVPLLPKDVVIVGRQEVFDRAITVLRLFGPGLPAWCEEPSHGGHYAWAACNVGGDGVVRFVPAGPVHSNTYERIEESFRNQN